MTNTVKINQRLKPTDLNIQQKTILEIPLTVNLRKVIKTRENRLSQNQTDVVSNATEWATLHQSANQNKTLTLLSPKEETSP